jgi:hypothetical protein
MKRTTSLLVFIFAITLGYGQGSLISDEKVIADFEGNPDNFGYSVVSARGHSVNGIADNPGKSDLNNTDKSYKGIRDEGSWNANVTIEWEIPVITEGRNFMSIMVYSEGYNAFVYLKIFHEGSVIREGWASEGTPAESDGQWAQAVLSIGAISQFDKMEIYLSNSWGENNEGAIGYFDEISIFKIDNPIPQPYPEVIFEVPFTKHETIIIDGSPSEDTWIAAEPGVFLDNDNVVNGRWFSSWDHEYLYFLFEIESDNILMWNDPGWNILNADGMRIFIDIKGRRLDNRVFGSEEGILIIPGLDSPEAEVSGMGFRNLLPFSDDYRSLTMQGSMITANKYTIEVAYPWLALAEASGLSKDDAYEWVSEFVDSGHESSILIELNQGSDSAETMKKIFWPGHGSSHNSSSWGILKLLQGSTSVQFTSTMPVLFISPVPANDFLHISMKGLRQLSVYQINGNQVISLNGLYDRVDLDISGLSPGMYILHTTDGEKKVVRKFIKQ